MALSEVKLQIIADDRDAQAKIKALSQELKRSGAEGAKGARGISQYSDATTDVGKSSKTAEVTVRSMGTKVQQAGSGMALAGAAAVSLWNAYDNVTDAAQKVEIAEAGVARGELTLSRAREALTKLQQSGTASALDLEQAQLAVTSAEGRLERSNLMLTNSQEALNEAWLNAATTIVPSIFTGVTGLTSVYEAFTSTIDEQIASYAQSAAAAQDSGIAIQGLGNNVLQVTDSATEATGAVTELGGGLTEVGASALEGGSAITELGADVTEFSGDAVEANAAVLELGSAMTETSANAIELNGAVLEAGGSVVELGADVTEFSGDMLETAGNTAELGGALGETGKTVLDLGNDVGTMGGALVEAEGALASTAAAGLLFQDRMKSVVKVMGHMVVTIGALAAKFVALPLAAAAAQLYSVSKAIESLTISTSGASQALDGFLGAFGKLFSFIPGATEAMNNLSISTRIYSEIWTELMSRLPVAGGLFQEQEGLASTLADKLGVLGNKSKEVEEEQAVLAQTAQTVDSEFAKLSPLVQEVAKAWGLYGIETEKVTQGQQRQMAHMQELDAALEPARQGVIDLATANGVDLFTALNMTDEQMRDFILNADNLGPTMEQQAEMSAAAAQKFAESWTAGLDAVTEAQNDWAQTMKGAMAKMGEEFGEELEVGISDIEKKVKKGLAFNDQFWEEIFPEDVIGAALVKGVNMEDTIDELKDTLDDVVGEGLITKDEAARWFGPLQEFMKEDLPADSEEAFGYLAGRMPHLIQKLKPAIINGMIEVGGAAKNAVNTFIVKPIQLGLGALETGESGLKFGQNILRNLEKNLGEIRKSSPQVAAAFQQVFDNIDLSADQKVQEIIAILGQINPAWRDQIMQMDSDADQIADIMDDKILGPVDQMRLGILLAFQDVAEAAGDMTWATKLGEKIAEINGHTEALQVRFEDGKGSIAGFSDAVFNSLDPITQQNVLLNANEIALQGVKVGGAHTIDVVEGFTGAEWDALTPIEQTNLRLAAQSKALDAVGKSASTAAGLIHGFTRAIQGAAQTKEIPGGGVGTAQVGTRLVGGSATASAKIPAAPKVPPPDTSSAHAVITQFYKDISAGWDSFWKSLSERDTQMPAPKSNILMEGLGQIFPTIIEAWDAFWNGMKSRDTQMPAPKSNILMTALGGIISTIAKTWGDFWNGLKQRDTQVPAPGTSLAKQGMEQFYADIKARWDEFWKSLKVRDVGGLEGGKSLGQASGLFEILQDIFGGNPPAEGATDGGETSTINFDDLKTKWNELQTHVTTVTSNMSALFAAHALSIQALINAYLVPAFSTYGTFLAGALNNVMVQTAQMSAQWINHAVVVGGQVDATGQHFIKLATGYSLLLQGVTTAMTNMAATWVGHAQAVGGQVDATGQNLIRLLVGYGVLASATHRSLAETSGYWSTHISEVTSSVNSVGQQLLRLATGYSLLANGVRIALNAGNSAWTNHRGAVQQAVNNGISSVGRLASAVASNMSRIVSSMNTATSAAGRLRSAISSLQSRNITVTTTYRTVGRPGGGGIRAAKGFSGVVNQPTRIFTGEGNRPELVQVTPLSPNASGGVKMNQAAAATASMPGVTPSMNRIFSQPTIRAGGSKGNTKRTDTVIFGVDGGALVFDANGNVKKMDFKSARQFDGGQLEWIESARKKAGKMKQLKGSEVTKKFSKREAAKNVFAAKGLERTVDPLMRSTKTGGLVGRGGKSLFDLGVASRGPSTRWVIDERRYADGSYMRRYSDASVEFGKDKFAKKKKAAIGFQGMVTKPTTFTVGEKGAEFVSVKPFNSGGGGAAAGGGGGGGRPIIIKREEHFHVNGKEFLKLVRSEELKGIYAMT